MTEGYVKGDKENLAANKGQIIKDNIAFYAYFKGLLSRVDMGRYNHVTNLVKERE